MSFASPPACETVVSLLRAFTLGAEGACISMDLWSVATVIIPFIVGVVVLQYLGRRLVGPRGASKRAPLDASANVYGADAPGAGPVRSTGAWRDKKDVR